METQVRKKRLFSEKSKTASDFRCGFCYYFPLLLKAVLVALKIEAMDRDNGAPVNKAQSSMLIASYKAGWDEAVKEQLQDSGSVIIELDTVIEYKGGQVYIKKMNASEMPATLTFNLIEALNKTIVEYYNNENKDETTEQKA